MFIKYDNIDTDRVVDVRSRKEFSEGRLFKYNLPVINEKEHAALKKFYPSAFFIIVASMYRNREDIKEGFDYVSDFKKKPFIIACSRGRLRSPLMYMYARLLGYDCKVLWNGIKPHLKASK